MSLLDRKVQFGKLTVEIIDADIERLKVGSCLNENLIDFFLCKRARNDIGDLSKCVASTRWFFGLSKERRIARVLKIPSHVNDSLSVNFLGVQQQHPEWFRSDLVFVPVHVDGCHWVLAVILNRSEPSPVSMDKCHAVIVVFDSLPSKGSVKRCNDIANKLRSFMNCEWYFRCVEREGKDVREFDSVTCPLIIPVVERQTNGSDCGLYVLRACETLLGSANELKPHLLLNDSDVDWLRVYLSGKVTVDGKSYRAELSREVL